MYEESEPIGLDTPFDRAVCALAASCERGLDPESPLYAAVSVLLVGWGEDEATELTAHTTRAAFAVAELVLQLDQADAAAETRGEVSYGTLARLDQLHAEIGESLDGLKSVLVA